MLMNNDFKIMAKLKAVQLNNSWRTSQPRKQQTEETTRPTPISRVRDFQTKNDLD